MSGSISFTGIPITIRRPGAYVEINNTRAQRGLSVFPTRVLLLGQKLAGGTGVTGVPFRVPNYAAARLAGGRGSLFAGMAEAFFANAPYLDTWGLLLDDLVAGAAATSTITVTGPALVSGTIPLLANGRRVQVGVTAGQSAASIATAIAAALNADGDLPFTAAAAAAVVTNTARNKGECGNGIDLRHSYYAGESLPLGVGLAITPFAGGTGNPAIQSALDALGDAWFTDYVTPWTDAANVTALEGKLLGDFGPMVMRDSMAWSAVAGSYSALQTYLDGRNGQVMCTFPLRGAPMAPWQWAAGMAGLAIPLLTEDPARPVQNVAARFLLPPPELSRFTDTERELFLRNGGSTFKVGAGGEVIAERLVTNYKLTASGAPDISYLNVETLKTVAFLRFDTRSFIGREWPRHKLANDGTDFARGQAVMTPGLAKSLFIARARQWETAGLVENLDQFKRDIIVERNPNDPDRLDMLLPPDLINQLRVTAAQIQFLL
jgi:phage tail sheath gpL-like